MKISDLKFITDIPHLIKEVKDIYRMRGYKYEEEELPFIIEKNHVYRYFYLSYKKLIERNPVFEYMHVEIVCRDIFYKNKEKEEYIWCVYLNAPLSVFKSIWGYTTPEAVFNSDEIFDDLSLGNSEKTYGGYCDDGYHTHDPVLSVGIDFNHTCHDHIRIKSPKDDLIPRDVANDALQIYQGIVSDYLYSRGVQEA